MILALLTALTLGCAEVMESGDLESTSVQETGAALTVALMNRSAQGSDLMSDHFCGGILVSEKVVVTAEHCVKDREADTISVLAGASDLCDVDSEDAIMVEVSRVEHGVGPSGQHAKLLLRGALPTPVGALPETPNGAQDPQAGDRAVAFGWGRSSIGGTAPCERQAKALVLVAPERCHIDEWADRSIEGFVCSVPEFTDNSCDGDSGGPVLIVRDDRVIAVAMTMSGWGCGSKSLGVNTLL